MKKYLSIIILALICCDANSQHEYNLSLGGVVSGDQGYSSYINNMSSYFGDESSVFNNSYSPRVGVDISLGYAYYIKHNLKVSASLALTQTGYRSSINSYNPDSGNGPVEKTYDNKIDINYLRTSIGATYITKHGFTFTAGLSINNLQSSTLKQEGTVSYPNSPSDSYFIKNEVSLTSEAPIGEPEEVNRAIGYNEYYDFYNQSNPYFGFGYEWGNLSVNYTYTSIAASPINGYKGAVNYISVGYSRLFKLKK